MQNARSAPPSSLHRLLHRAARILGDRPWLGTGLAIALVLAVAMLDFVTGYEMRLAIMYSLPIALATWTAGWRAGTVVAWVAVACWGVGFHPTHIYTHSGYYYWEGAVLVATFAVFILLLHHLRTALERSDQRLLQVLQDLPAAIYVKDADSGRLLYANRHFGELTGEPIQEQVSTFERRLQLQAPASGAEPSPEDARFHEARDEASGRWFLKQTSTLQWEDEQRVELHVLLDVSDRKQAAALRRRHQELLYDAARSAVLTEIASMLGHEINQPLMAIATYNEAGLMLGRNPPDLEQVGETLRKSRAQALRASDIVQRTRNFLRRRAPTQAASDINALAREAVQALELEMQDQQIEILWELDSATPPLLFDPTLIQQVLVNLLRNAAEAVARAPERRVLVRTRRMRSGVEVTVADSGPGIPDEIADQLFSPFFTTKPQGIGLGLCICRSIVEAHAGNLWQAPGELGGAAFHFTLPDESADAGNQR